MIQLWQLRSKFHKVISYFSTGVSPFIKDLLSPKQHLIRGMRIEAGKEVFKKIKMGMKNGRGDKF